MKSAVEEPATNGVTGSEASRTCQWEADEVEIATRIERSISAAKASISEKLDDGKFAAERLLKHGRYAIEDRVSELAHKIKKHPVGSLGIAFAAGTIVGLLLSRSSHPQDAD